MGNDALRPLSEALGPMKSPQLNGYPKWRLTLKRAPSARWTCLTIKGVTFADHEARNRLQFMAPALGLCPGPVPEVTRAIMPEERKLLDT